MLDAEAASASDDGDLDAFYTTITDAAEPLPFCVSVPGGVVRARDLLATTQGTHNVNAWCTQMNAGLDYLARTMPEDRAEVIETLRHAMLLQLDARGQLPARAVAQRGHYEDDALWADLGRALGDIWRELGCEGWHWARLFLSVTLRGVMQLVWGYVPPELAESARAYVLACGREYARSLRAPAVRAAFGISEGEHGARQRLDAHIDGVSWRDVLESELEIMQATENMADLDLASLASGELLSTEHEVVREARRALHTQCPAGTELGSLDRVRTFLQMASLTADRARLRRLYAFTLTTREVVRRFQRSPQHFSQRLERACMRDISASLYLLKNATFDESPGTISV